MFKKTVDEAFKTMKIIQKKIQFKNLKLIANNLMIKKSIEEICVLLNNIEQNILKKLKKMKE